MSIKNPKDYLYYGTKCAVDDVTYNLKSGGKLKLILPDKDDYHAFAGITKRSGNRAGQILKILYRFGGEEEFREMDGWFAGWSVNHTKGCVIAMTLDEEGFDQWRHVDKGAILEAMFYQIEDDGEHYSEEQRKKVESKLKGGVLSIQAGKACQDHGFRRFLEEESGLEKMSLATPEDAADAVRAFCGVESRAEIDHNEKAKGIWKRIYRKWLATSL